MVRGAPERGRDLVSIAHVVEALVGAAEPAGRFLVGDEYLADDQALSPEASTRVPDPTSTADRLRAYLAAGHPLVWNGAAAPSPPLDALTATLAQAFGAEVWSSVYGTGIVGTPLHVHVDARELLAVQCEGVRESGPTRASALTARSICRRSSLPSALPSRRAATKPWPNRSRSSWSSPATSSTSPAASFTTRAPATGLRSTSP